MAMATSSTPPLPTHLALELRLRQVEYNVLGADALSGTSSSSQQLPILLRAQSAQQTVQSVGSSHSGSSSSSSSSLRRFVQTDFDACRRFLQAQPQPHALRSAASDDDAAGSLSASSTSTLTPSEQLVMILDAEESMRSLERCLAQCRELGEKRDAAGPGRLAEYEAFEPVLQTLKGHNEEEIKPQLRQVEDQLLQALSEYQTFIDSLSRLYIQWDEFLSDMERQVTRMEREADEEEKQGA